MANHGVQVEQQDVISAVESSVGQRTQALPELFRQRRKWRLITQEATFPTALGASGVSWRAAVTFSADLRRSPKVVRYPPWSRTIAT